jgi:hypothetical protein
VNEFTPSIDHKSHNDALGSRKPYYAYIQYLDDFRNPSLDTCRQTSEKYARFARIEKFVCCVSLGAALLIRWTSCALFAHLSCCALWFAPEFAHAADTPLSTQIDKLTAALKDSDVAKDAAAQTALTNLLKTLGQASCAAAPVDNALCKVGQIQALADATAPSFTSPQAALTGPQNDALWKSLRPALEIPVKESGKSSDETIINALDFVKRIFVDQPFKLSEPLKTAAQLGSVNDAISLRVGDATGGTSTQSIRIDGAWFGDINAIRHALARHAGDHQTGEPDAAGGLSPWDPGYRYCSATRAVRAICQSQSQCFQPGASGSAAGSAGVIAGASLCGFDPTPFADPRVHGLVVRYRCLASNDPRWFTFAARDDRISPQFVTTGAANHEALLRPATTAIIQCPKQGS